MSSVCRTRIQVRQANSALVGCQNVNDEFGPTQRSFTNVLKCLKNGANIVFAESERGVNVVHSS
jgi:hypothetical protein